MHANNRRSPLRVYAEFVTLEAAYAAGYGSVTGMRRGPVRFYSLDCSGLRHFGYIFTLHIDDPETGLGPALGRTVTVRLTSTGKYAPLYPPQVVARARKAEAKAAALVQPSRAHRRHEMRTLAASCPSPSLHYSSSDDSLNTKTLTLADCGYCEGKVVVRT